MPAPIIPITGRREAVYVLVQIALPGASPQPAGVVLMDPATDRGWVRMRSDFTSLTDDTEVFDAIEADFQQRISESGAAALLNSLEDTLSNTVLVSARQTLTVDAFTRALGKLYSEHVEPVAVAPYRTHLPLYSLRAAAGRLGEEMPVEPEDWVPAPDGLRLTDDLFVAHVVGKSMEPRIPDGSLNLFRFHPVGSRQGKILLIQRFGSTDESAQFTVKRYTSFKRVTGWGEWGDVQWEHEQIRLQPLNPDFEPWDVEPEDFAVVAEWLRVIE
jgi:phage repressor protein C with HTH and peptisase S24 domain